MDKKDLISSHRSNVYGNFLMHWKYIKREKVGDKWKYTYKDDAVTDARSKFGKSVIDYKKAVATENKLKADKTHDGELSKTNLDMADARVEAWQATNNAKRAVEKARKEYDTAKAKSDASIGNRITKALNGEKSTKEVKDKGVVEKQLSNGVTYTVPYDEKLDGPREDKTKKTIITKKETITDKAKNAVDTAKDKLGVDEREKYKDVKAKYEKAVAKSQDTYHETQKAINDFLDNPSSSTSEKMDSKISDNEFWKRAVKTRGEEYVDARSEYMKTPLGTALRAKEALEDARIEVDAALAKLIRKLKKNK